jgi:hypothetical protein
MVKTIKNKELKKGVVSYTVAFLLCMIVAIFRYITGNDIMSLTVFKSKTLGDMTGEKGVYSLWPISHFILYVFLGYLSPSWWWLWICLGIGWEFFEYSCGLLVRKLQSKEGTSNLGQKAEKMFMPQYGEEWVSGCQSDVLFNISGLVIGLMMSKLYKTDYKETYYKKSGLSLKIIYYSNNISSTSFPNYKDKDRYDQPYDLSTSLE